MTEDDPRWHALGVLNDQVLATFGHLEASDRLGAALFGFLEHRTALDDAVFASLLDVAVATGEPCALQLAAWEHLTPAQLGLVAAHPGATAAPREHARRLLRFVAFEHGEPMAVDLVRLVSAWNDPAPSFRILAFPFNQVWSGRLDDASRRDMAALFAKLEPAEEMRCHLPAFGLQLDADTAAPTRVSICFQCNNIYMTGGGHRTFDAASGPARELLAMMKRFG